MKLAILPAALAYSPIRRGYGLADPETPRYARSRSGRGPRLAQAGRAIKPGPGGLKPRAGEMADFSLILESPCKNFTHSLHDE